MVEFYYWKPTPFILLIPSETAEHRRERRFILIWMKCLVADIWREIQTEAEWIDTWEGNRGHCHCPSVILGATVSSVGGPEILSIEIICFDWKSGWEGLIWPCRPVESVSSWPSQMRARSWRAAFILETLRCHWLHDSHSFFRELS